MSSHRNENMQVLLIKGHQCRIVKNVLLEFGCKPLVEGKGLEAPQNNEPFQIDPVIWYKTYVVKTVYIDCERRCVAWTRDEHPIPELDPHERVKNRRKSGGSARVNVTVPQNAEYLFADPDIYDFDSSPDNLIDDALSLLEKNGAKQVDEKMFRNELARLLHCYILPAIKLSPQDVPALEDALGVVTKSCSLVEGDLLNRVKSTELVEASLQRQRERLMKQDDYESETYLRSCNRDFLNKFLKHIERDITCRCNELEIIQTKINTLKKQTARAETSRHADSENLVTLREDRDVLHRHVEKLRIVRESIKNVTQRPCRSKRLKKIKIKQNLFHTIYIELSGRFESQKEELQQIAIMKVKITAVKETLSNKIKKLNQMKNLAASQASLGGMEDMALAMDVLGLDHRPKGWLTLDEKVEQLLITAGNKAFQTHQDHVTMIKDKVKAVKDELHLFQAGSPELLNVISGDMETDGAASSPPPPSPPNGGLVETQGMSARNRRSTRLRASNVSSTEITVYLATDTILENAVHDVKERILAHINKMCPLLQTLMPEFQSMSMDKIWMAYQTFHSEELLPVLRDLYFQLKMERCQDLHQKVKRLTLEDLVGKDLIQRLLMQPRRQASFGSRRDRASSSSSTSSHRRSSSWCELSSLPRSEPALTLEISRCTSEDLYKMVSSDCESLPSNISNMMDPPSYNSSPSFSETSSESMGMVGEAGGGLESFDPEEELRDRMDCLCQDFYHKLQAMLKARTVLEKLRGLTKMFKVVEKHLADVLRHGSFGADYLIPMTVLVLISLDEEFFTALYVEMTMLIDLMPPCLQSGAHDYSLTNFFVAYQSLFDEHKVTRSMMLA